MAKKTSNAVTTKTNEDNDALVVAGPLMAEMHGDSGGGFEEADRSAYAIPFITILQSGSPQCKRSDGAYIKGAEEGMLFNTVTQEIFDGETGIIVIPAFYTRRFTRWGARKAGGGFKGEYMPSDPIIMTCHGEDGGRGNYLPDDNGEFNKDTSDILNDTRSHYVIALGANDSYTPALVTMTSTQIKKSKQWMSKMDGLKLKGPDGVLFTPPMFSHSYRLTTVPENNDQGSWYGWKIELDKPVTNVNLYNAARHFRDAVRSGEVKAAPAPSENVAPNDDDTDPFA